MNAHTPIERPNTEADDVLRYAQAWARADRSGDTATLVNASVLLLVAVWKRLPWNKRMTFLSRLDRGICDKNGVSTYSPDTGTLDYVPGAPLSEAMKRDIEFITILKDWDQVTRGITDANLKGFCLSILKMRNKPGWKPTEKQEALIRDLHKEWRQSARENNIPDDAEVTED